MFGPHLLRRTPFIAKNILPRTSAPQRRWYNSLTLDSIHTYGSLIIRCPHISATVRCINPHEVPNGDKSFISLKSTHQDLDLKQFEVNYEKENSVISITLSDQVVEGAVQADLHIEVPHIYDLDIEADNVHVLETEGDNLTVKAGMKCTLGKIKSLNTDIVCGDCLNCNNLFGDGRILTQESLSVKKLQSKHMAIHAGSIDIAAAYCRDLKCQTEEGDIKIKDLHGVAEVTSNSGNVTIGSIDGDLNVTTVDGNVDVTVEKCGLVDIRSSEGDLDIGLGDNVSAFLEAKGKHIEVPEDLLVDGMKYQLSSGQQTFEGKFGLGVASIVSKTDLGTVSYARKTWFSKFQLSED